LTCVGAGTAELFPPALVTGANCNDETWEN
jgi:hypothetical protein